MPSPITPSPLLKSKPRKRRPLVSSSEEDLSPPPPRSSSFGRTIRKSRFFDSPPPSPKRSSKRKSEPSPVSSDGEEEERYDYSISILFYAYLIGLVKAYRFLRSQYQSEEPLERRCNSLQLPKTQPNPLPTLNLCFPLYLSLLLFSQNLLLQLQFRPHRHIPTPQSQFPLHLKVLSLLYRLSRPSTSRHGTHFRIQRRPRQSLPQNKALSQSHCLPTLRLLLFFRHRRSTTLQFLLPQLLQCILDLHFRPFLRCCGTNQSIRK